MRNTLILGVFLAVLSAAYGDEATPIQAVAVVKGPTGVHGNITFTQAGCGKPVTVEISVMGLTPGKHGFHVHEKGDLTEDCASFAGHYNPDKVNHGAPDASVRHVGDLGNIIADDIGRSIETISDSIISLTGPRSIIGRGLVIHQGVDDLGLGKESDSLTTGHAGARAACGVIGYKSFEDVLPCTGSGHSLSNSLILVAIIFIVTHLINRRAGQ